MTLSEQLKSLAEKATPGPWDYRPDEYDDWGVLKSQPREVGNYEPPFILRGHIAQFRDPDLRDYEVLDEHRRAGTDPWAANAKLVEALVNNLPTILAALEAVEWVYPKSREDMPVKPGQERYEYVDCLILHRGDLLFRPWNCEHLVFDSEDYDDFFCEWSDIEAYQIVRRPLGPTPENTHDL